jgi:hypothetical protein
MALVLRGSDPRLTTLEVTIASLWCILHASTKLPMMISSMLRAVDTDLSPM